MREIPHSYKGGKRSVTCSKTGPVTRADAAWRRSAKIFELDFMVVGVNFPKCIAEIDRRQESSSVVAFRRQAFS